MKLGFDQSNLTNLVILGIPVVGILAALSLAVSYFRRYRKSPAMLMLGYITVIVVSFTIGGLVGLSRMRTEHLAFAYNVDCQTRFIYKGQMTLDVMRESIAETESTRLWLIQADQTHNMCADILHDLDTLRKLPHVYVVDGFKRLIEIRAYTAE